MPPKKVRIAVPQIRCRRVTHPKTSADEIYLAYFVSLGKPTGDKTGGFIKRHVAKCVSSVEMHVEKNSVWTPVGIKGETETPEMVTEIDMGDAQALFVVFALYEQDDGGLYRRIKEEVDKPLPGQGFEWELIELPNDPTKPLDWLKVAWKAFKASVNYFRQDDLMAAIPVVVDFKGEDAVGWTGSRELEFKDFGGDYRVTLSLKPAEEPPA